VANIGSYGFGLCREYSATPGYRAGLRLGVDDHSRGGGADHRRDQNRTGRPDSTGRTAGVSGLYAAGALSIDPGGLLKVFDAHCLSVHRQCAAQPVGVSDWSFALRFLNFGERFELPVVLQNKTNEPMSVEVVVETDNSELTNGAGRRFAVPERDRVEVRFPAMTASAVAQLRS
jgi:hypothetical protein